MQMNFFSCLKRHIVGVPFSKLLPCRDKTNLLLHFPKVQHFELGKEMYEVQPTTKAKKIRNSWFFTRINGLVFYFHAANISAVKTD